MSYSIGEVSVMTGIAISTLRYYDREGLFPDIERSGGGIRMFSDSEMETLRIIECLKMTDMPIKDIKQFLDWCQEGDSSLERRRAMFYERLAVMNQKLEEMRNTLGIIKYKCWYYDMAVAAKNEEAVKNMSVDEAPEEFREYMCQKAKHE